MTEPASTEARLRDELAKRLEIPERGLTLHAWNTDCPACMVLQEAWISSQKIAMGHVFY